MYKVQKSLKIKMEAQGRFLEKIGQEHPNTKPTKLRFSPTSLPSLCDDSYQSNAKDQSESDSEEADKNETIQSDQEGFRSLKRLRIDEEIRFPTIIPEFYSQSMVFSEDADDEDHIPYPEQDFSFSWNNNIVAAQPAHRLWCQAFY